MAYINDDKEWVHVNDDYVVNRQGVVKSVDREYTEPYNRRFYGSMVLRQGNRVGYRYVTLCKKGFKKVMSVHRLVAQAFIANPENKPHVNHKNGIRHDNRVENLEWCTPRENIIHARKNLPWKPYPLFGENHPKAKLTLDQVKEIARRYKAKEANSIQLAGEYGVSRNWIYGIARNKKWGKDYLPIKNLTVFIKIYWP